ncbi:hypothetical protein ACIQMZ_37270 [Streptomyces longwoodensis]|uniref:hypothetical protein n=1 Tax=Streptomyces longwoodensis TaxID=68231 RepID=UPI003807D8B1
MAAYSGNLLRMAAPQDPKIVPGAPDPEHAEPSGPEALAAFRAQEIAVPADLGTEYAGLTLEDGIPRAITAGQPGLGWNAPEEALQVPGSGATPAGQAPGWTAGDPHSANVDTSYAGNARGAIAGSPYAGSITGAHATGDDTLPYRRANPVGVEGTSFLERLVGFPEQIGAEPMGPGADKFVAGTNSWSSSNPEGDQYTHRSGARVHYGFDTGYFVHTPMFQDKPAQTYERRTTPVTARDPLVGGSYPRTPALGQLAANPWLSELGSAPDPGSDGYGVPVDGVV